MAHRRRIKVEYKKLGKFWGFGHTYPIQLDERLRGKKHLEILIHECLHHINPDLSEDAVVRDAVTLANTLWHEGYRRIDNSNDIPLQDGKK